VEYRQHEESQARLSDAAALQQQAQRIPSVHVMPGLRNGVLLAFSEAKQSSNIVDLADRKLPLVQRCCHRESLIRGTRLTYKLHMPKI
jgi:hypothetical protein